MLLALIVWIGGIIFFAFVLAPTVFAPGVLPSRDLAGNVVNPALAKLHWMGMAAGVVFLASSLIGNRIQHAQFRPFAATHVLIVMMLALTAFSQFVISPKMHALRTQMGVIDYVPGSDVRRIEFNRWHQWSTRSEGAVLFLGLGVVVLTARWNR